MVVWIEAITEISGDSATARRLRRGAASVAVPLRLLGRGPHALRAARNRAILRSLAAVIGRTIRVVA